MPNAIQQQDPSAASQPPARYVPPHRNGTLSDTRYSKDQLIDLYRAQQNSEGGLSDQLSELYVGGWQPDHANGVPSAGWGRTEHSRDGQPGPDVCWDADGSVQPMALYDMDDEEREVRDKLHSSSNHLLFCANHSISSSQHQSIRHSNHPPQVKRTNSRMV